MKFVRNVAWWLWSRKRENFFVYAELPKDIIYIVTDRRSVTAEAIVRELLIGSILDRGISSLLEAKGQDFYYFAHKSYWEFLVCEYILRDDLTEKDIDILNDRLTPEVLQFLGSADEVLYARLYHRLSDTRVKAHIALFELAGRHPLAVSPFESDRYNLNKNEFIALNIGLRNHRETKGFDLWQEFFFEAEKQSGANFSGMIFGLIYRHATEGTDDDVALYTAAVLCCVAAQRWLQRLESKRVQEISLDSDQEACLSSFLESIESIDSTGAAIDCRMLVTRLIERDLAEIYEPSLNDITLSTEYLEADRLEQVGRMSDLVSPLFSLRQAHSKLTGIRADLE